MSEMQRWFLYQTFVHKNQPYDAIQLRPLHLSYSLVLYAEIQINLGPGKSGGFPLHARVPGSVSQLRGLCVNFGSPSIVKIGDFKTNPLPLQEVCFQNKKNAEGGQEPLDVRCGGKRPKRLCICPCHPPAVVAGFITLTRTWVKTGLQALPQLSSQ